MAKKSLQALLNTPEVRTWRALMSAFQAVYSKIEKELVDEGLSVSRFQVLFHLYFEGPLKASQLSAIMLVSRSNMSTFLKRMKQDGLIDFKFFQGKKRPQAYLTSQGIKFFF